MIEASLKGLDLLLAPLATLSHVFLLPLAADELDQSVKGEMKGIDLWFPLSHHPSAKWLSDKFEPV